MIPSWIDNYCTEHGWTDPFVNEGRYWAFPPHAVIPLPVPATRPTVLPTNRFHIVRAGGKEIFLFDLTVIAFHAMRVSDSWVSKFAFSSVAAIGDWAELGLTLEMKSVEYRFDVLTMRGWLAIEFEVYDISPEGLQLPESWDDVRFSRTQLATELLMRGRRPRGMSCLVEARMEVAEVRQCQQQQG